MRRKTRRRRKFQRQNLPQNPKKKAVKAEKNEPIRPKSFSELLFAQSGVS
ncbi:MAG: hypothetical protein ACLR07_00120 [Christensenellales bacterium]